MRYRFELGCAACIAAFILAASFDEQANQPAPHAQVVHKKKKAQCPTAPCLDTPMACFMRGGAPEVPQCLRD